MAISISVPGQIFPPNADPEISLPPELNPVNRDTNFSGTVSARVIVDVEGGGPSEIIEQVSAELLGIADPEIVITPGINSVLISGKHTTTFRDVFTYVSVGSSNLIETAKTAVGAAFLPDPSNMYDLNQDGALEKVRQFKIIVTYYILSQPNAKLTAEFTVPQTVNNSLEAVRQFMANYNYNNYKGL
jgi:hypothetical protein